MVRFQRTANFSYYHYLNTKWLCQACQEQHQWGSQSISKIASASRSIALPFGMNSPMHNSNRTARYWRWWEKGYAFDRKRITIHANATSEIPVAAENSPLTWIIAKGTSAVTITRLSVEGWAARFNVFGTMLLAGSRLQALYKFIVFISLVNIEVRIYHIIVRWDCYLYDSLKRVNTTKHMCVCDMLSFRFTKIVRLPSWSSNTENKIGSDKTFQILHYELCFVSWIQTHTHTLSLCLSFFLSFSLIDKSIIRDG